MLARPEGGGAPAQDRAILAVTGLSLGQINA
jgi:hypothetical protein